MRKAKGFILFFSVATLLSFTSRSSPVKKDDSQSGTGHQTLYFGGDIITMEGATPSYAEAVVQQNGKIVFVGSRKQATIKFKNATLFDLKGRTMVPAFLDGHGHFYNVGFMASCANLLPPPDGPSSNFEMIIEALNRYKESEDGKAIQKKLGWIIGNGYDDSQLSEKEHPKSTDLDRVSKEVPVIIIHQSGHIASVNTKGLEILGIQKGTPNPQGGNIRRHTNGNPTGVLEEAAFFENLLPILAKMDDELAMKCIRKGQEEYARNGYLTAQDGRTTIEQLEALKKASNEHLFYLDVVAYPDIVIAENYLKKGNSKPAHQYQNHFRVGGVKLTLDGSPQGKTAWLTQCYHKNPEGRTGCYEGYPVMSDEKANGFVKTAFENKWQIICHVNGDAAIDQYLRAVKNAEKEFGYDDHRTVLIHGQTLRKNQIPELVSLGIMPSLFPMHTFYWGDWHRESVLGEPRADYISPCRDVIDAGLKLTSHHDAPVTMPNSMRVLDATVNRVTRSGKVLGPEQRITPYEGLKTLTDWAAYQYFEEASKGTIKEGKVADFVILDRNPLKVEPLKIHDIRVVESIKGGKSVYSEKI